MVTARQSTAEVLIVEDDAGIRETLLEILEEEGYQAAAASNGWEALQVMRRAGPPCVLVTDLMMPVMDGWELLGQVRQDAALASVPVVIITGDGRAEVRAEALGTSGCLLKPLDIGRLLSLVERYCA